jgi:formate hydrogenlyase subunit 3/multisubunit Na+/H+ antiporter MnhD subunit
MIAPIAIYLPFFAAFFMLWTRLGTTSRQAVSVVAAAPAIWMALTFGAGESIVIPWLFLEAHLGLDLVRQVFLLFTSLLWATAGLYAGAYLRGQRHERVFYFLYLLAMSGNVGLIVAEDIATFYTFFALMTFAAYGLVVSDRSERAMHAGRVYMVMAVIGEAMILGAVFLTLADADSHLLSSVGQVVAASPYRNVIIFLTLGGFGVKAGMIGLHMWLPLAHPVAPTPASAVLSGAMIKAGLVGWIHFLPLGEYESHVWSAFVIVVGLGAAFGAVIVGALQEDPKTNLAYSSISQMGVMTMAVGVGLAEPGAWPVVMAVLVVYAFSHGLAKGALFLGVGIAHAASSTGGRILAMSGLTLAAAAIAGAPMTGGAIVKKALADAISFAPGTWPDRLEWLLVGSAVATTVLLGRFLQIVWRDVRAEATTEPHPSLWWSWVFILGLVAGGVWIAVPHYAIDVTLPRLALVDAWDAIWPMMLGLVLLFGWWRIFSAKRVRMSVPAGDLLVPVEAVLRYVRRAWIANPIPGPSTWEINFEPFVERIVESDRKRALMSRIEKRLMHWDNAGSWFVLLIVVLVALLMIEHLS